MTEGFALHEIICDDSGKPRDYRFLDINPAFERLTGLKKDDMIGKTVSESLPGTESFWIERYGNVALTGESVHFENYSSALKRHYEVFAYRPAPKQFAVLFFDITDRKQAEEALRKTAAELARSNEELEQFAYVASHDLQEPLRAVGGYLGLIETRLQDVLDEKARQHLDGAIQGAARMQRLISDLLAISRVGTQGKPFAKVDFNDILDQAIQNVDTGMREVGATLNRDPLPTLSVDAGQMAQLFQNLLGNAVKFRGEQPPEIRVGAQRLNDGWRFSVRDNGLGIEPQYFQRIFLIFQRLHTRKQYPGTGIGLAICKKIVERHGGNIWVESQPGQGSTFYFTVPDEGAPNGLTAATSGASD